jgi:DNA-binding response OmpR family regulator
MGKSTILAVEDDAAIRRGVVDALQYAGYRVLGAGTFEEGLRMALSERCDLLLLDVVLPDGSGLDILSEIRDERPQQPVILLTARGDEQDRVAGLRRGADDYVVKPFSVRELLARVEAVLRRCGSAGQEQGSLALNGHGTIDFAACELARPDGSRVELSPREVQLVQYLSSHPGRVVSREEILQQVWGIDARGVNTRTIDMHVARLREKLRDNAAHPDVIATVRGRGYRWQSPQSAN